MSFEELELSWVEALSAEAQAIHARFAEHLAIFEGNGGGVGFDGPFVNTGKIETFAQA